MRVADLNASSALDTVFSLKMMAVFCESVTILRTDRRAKTTTHAFCVIIKEFWDKRMRFGIVTPRAIQRATLQEDHRTDAWPVVDCKFLNIEDQRRGVHLEMRSRKQVLHGDEERISKPASHAQTGFHRRFLFDYRTKERTFYGREDIAADMPHNIQDKLRGLHDLEM